MNNIYGASSFFISNNYDYLNGQILGKLTPLQKKVGAIVLAVLAGLTGVYALYCCWKKPQGDLEIVSVLPKEQEKQAKEMKKAKEIKKTKEIEKIIHTKNANVVKEIKQETKKPKVEVVQQIQEIKIIEEKDSIPEELKKEVQELLETLNACLEKMAKSTNQEFKTENEWNHSIYEFRELSKLISEKICLGLKESLQLLESEEKLIEGLQRKLKILPVSVNQVEKRTEVSNEFNLIDKQVDDCCHKLNLRLETYKLSFYGSSILKNRIAFMEEFQSICGNKGQHIRGICETWVQLVNKINQMKERIHSDYLTLLAGIPQDNFIKNRVEQQDTREKKFLELQQQINRMIEAFQEVSIKIDRIREIGEHILKFYQSLDKQKVSYVPL